MPLAETIRKRSFLRAVFETIIAWLGAAQGLEWFWKTAEFENPEVVWAYTAATAFAVLYFFMYLCYSKQAVLQNRINEMAKAKKDLEQALLKKRQSSRRTNP
jgi:C4-dicarboxylate-specific signal transduction histidine kinase